MSMFIGPRNIIILSFHATSMDLSDVLTIVFGIIATVEAGALFIPACIETGRRRKRRSADTATELQPQEGIGSHRSSSSAEALPVATLSPFLPLNTETSGLESSRSHCKTSRRFCLMIC